MRPGLTEREIDRLAVAGALSLVALTVRDPSTLALGLQAALNLEIERGDFLAHVREEVEVSRAGAAQMLKPVDTLHRAVDALGHALRQCGPDLASRCVVKQCCAEIAALAVRLATEGTPVFPATLG